MANAVLISFSVRELFGSLLMTTAVGNSVERSEFGTPTTATADTSLGNDERMKFSSSDGEI